MDTKILLALDVPVRECVACPFKGVILVNALLSFQGTPIFQFEPEHPSPADPDTCRRCPVCGKPLKVRDE